jgi:uncharacterized protein YycO
MELLRKTSLIISAILIFVCGCGRYEPRTGDIVFQDLRSSSSEAIKTATDSPYSHCGMVVVEDGSAYVVEAVGPVRKIPLADWIDNGDGLYTAMRMTGSIDFDKAIEEAEKYTGLPYDGYYSWDEEKLYCSELVYKAFQKGCGVELCPLRPVEAYALEKVKTDILERFSKMPEGLMVVTPADLALSETLQVVYSNMESR